VRIAFVVPELHKRGGTERCVASLGEALAARGHRIAVFSSTKEREALPGATWYRVPMLRRPNAVRFASFLVMNSVVRLGARVFKGERFDVVHSTGPDVLRPSVTTFHACSAAFARRLRSERTLPEWQRWRRLRRWSNILAYRVISLCEGYVLRKGAGRVVVISDTLAREIREMYELPDDRLDVVSDGVDPAEFDGTARPAGQTLREELGISEGEPVVLFVGHNWQRKGLDTLISALRLVRDREGGTRPVLLIVGGGGRRSYEDRVRAALKGAVRFLGTRCDMATIYGAADLFVLPTTHEPFGLPVLEAMASGVAVVVSACAGVAELITDGVDGIVLRDPADAEELAQKIEHLLRDRPFRTSLGEQASKMARTYSWREIARRVEDVYRGARPGSSPG
jgi:UDP-glucose:(heptosyl)LPS alpha-1,3-glucosyltransferase